jgi:aminoglycoside phosphotransferase (APT) family kinase protein
MTTTTSTADPGVLALEELRALGGSTRDAPPSGLGELLAERYPTEREFEKMLDRKLRLRGAERPSGHGDLSSLERSLRGLLDANLSTAYAVRNLRWLSGGASKIQMAFTLDWDDPASGRSETELVVRMEPREALNTTSRAREFQLLRVMVGRVPVPRVYWVDEEATWFPEPALVYAFATGVTKPSGKDGRVTGIGGSFGPDLRGLLAGQFVQHLASVHTTPIEASTLTAFEHPRPGTTDTALWQLNRARRVWEEDRGEDFPVLEVAAVWLEQNLPVLDQPSLLHGDFRSGNFLFDEPTGEITAWLDWERGHVGDRHRDLAWTIQPESGSRDEQGRFLVSGLLPVDEFLAAYQERSGLTVDPARMHYYKVLNHYQIVVSLLGTAYRVVRLGMSHQDVLLAWMEGIVYSFVSELRRALEEE